MLGYSTSIIAGATPALEADWGALEPMMSGLVTASILCGTALGSLSAGMIADRIGRQKTAIIMSLGSLFFCILEGVAMNLPMLIVTRVFLGFFIGLISVVCPLYVSETAPSEKRGFLGSFFQVSITFGIVIAYIMGFLLQPSPNTNVVLAWRTMFGLGAIPSLFLLFVALFFMQESPVWLEQRASKGLRHGDLLAHGGFESASDSAIYSSSSINASAHASDPLLRGASASASSQSMSFSNPFAAQATVQGWRGLFSRPTLLPLVIGILLALDLQATGINGILFFLPKVLSTRGSPQLAPILTIVVGVVNFLSTFFALFLVDRSGRKPLLLIGTSIMGLSLALVGVSFYVKAGSVWFTFVSVSLFHVGFEIGPGCLFWIIISEIFPAGVRSEANSFINLVQNLLTLFVCLLFPQMLHVLKGGVFFGFAAIAVFIVVALSFLYKETKDESPLQMLTIQTETLS